VEATTIPASVKLNNGHSIPHVGFGTWEFKGLNVSDFTLEVIKAGYRHIDTASFYGNEKELGDGIKRAIEAKLVTREDLFITTKIFNGEKPDPAAALKRSLDNLGLPYVDLYLIHWPIGVVDPETKQIKQVPLHKTWPALEALVKNGSTKSIGVSNFNVQLLLDLLSYAEIKPACNQVEINPLIPQEDLVNFCQK